MVATAVENARPSIETLEAILDVTYTWGYQETREKLNAMGVEVMDTPGGTRWRRKIDL